MSDKRSAAFSVIAITVIIAFSFVEVDTQSTVDDSASCESYTFDAAVNLIREELRDVKNVCASNQRQCSPTESSSSKRVIASSFLGDYRTHYLKLSMC